MISKRIIQMEVLLSMMPKVYSKILEMKTQLFSLLGHHGVCYFQRTLLTTFLKGGKNSFMLLPYSPIIPIVFITPHFNCSNLAEKALHKGVQVHSVSHQRE